MSKKNSNLHSAKMAKNNEFYTLTTDIEKEMFHYRGHFKDKVIFLNCDDDTKSNFWKYFKLNIDFLGIKKVIGTHYDDKKPTYKIELFRDETGSIKEVITPLKCNGDFRSPESLDILKEADIVVTNPPFSLFREFIEVLFKYEKDFLIIGSLNAISYKEVFSLIKKDLLWLGVHNGAKTYIVPNDYEGTHKEVDGVKYATLGNTVWYTNLEHHFRNEKIHLIKQYDEDQYPSYDNYDAIEVSKVVDIPMDYRGVMGVPVTFLGKHNPEQFEIVGAMTTTKVTEDNHGYPYVNGKKKYARVLIKHK